MVKTFYVIFKPNTDELDICKISHYSTKPSMKVSNWKNILSSIICFNFFLSFFFIYHFVVVVTHNYDIFSNNLFLAEVVCQTRWHLKVLLDFFVESEIHCKSNYLKYHRDGRNLYGDW